RPRCPRRDRLQPRRSLSTHHAGHHLSVARGGGGGGGPGGSGSGRRQSARHRRVQGPGSGSAGGAGWRAGVLGPGGGGRDRVADVMKLEPPGGDPSRHFGPFPHDIPHPERSGLFLHLNRNKRSVVVDPASADGAALIRTLTAEAHIVLEDYAPGSAAGWGWGW